jgi:hypothetical protein
MFGLPGQMLASAETNFQPKGLNAVRKLAQRVSAGGIGQLC